MALERPEGYVAGLPNCGVVAIAVMTGAHYTRVWNWFAKKQVKPSAWKGRTMRRHYEAASLAMGVRLERLIVNRRITVAKFVELHTLPDVAYMVRVSGHVFVVHNGVITDNSVYSGAHVSEYGKRRCIVTDVWCSVARA